MAALQGLAPSPRIFYLGTFSKSTYADIRLGYLVVPEALVEVFELAQRHMGMLAPLAMQDALAEFIGAGAYLGHIRRMNRLYKERRDRMLQALATEAGSRLSVEAPAGGMQLLAAAAARPTTGNCRRGCLRPVSSAARCRACCITRAANRACFSASRRGTRRRSTRPRASSGAWCAERGLRRRGGSANGDGRLTQATSRSTPRNSARGCRMVGQITDGTIRIDSRNSMSRDRLCLLCHPCSSR